MMRVGWSGTLDAHSETAERIYLDPEAGWLSDGNIRGNRGLKSKELSDCNSVNVIYKR